MKYNYGGHVTRLSEKILYCQYFIILMLSISGNCCKSPHHWTHEYKYFGTMTFAIERKISNASEFARVKIDGICNLICYSISYLEKHVNPRTTEQYPLEQSNGVNSSQSLTVFNIFDIHKDKLIAHHIFPHRNLP